jgi:hypothetical protein
LTSGTKTAIKGGACSNDGDARSACLLLRDETNKAARQSSMIDRAVKEL